MSEWDSGCQNGVCALPRLPEVSLAGPQKTEKGECVTTHIPTWIMINSGLPHLKLVVDISIQTIRKLCLTLCDWQSVIGQGELVN